MIFFQIRPKWKPVFLLLSLFFSINLDATVIRGRSRGECTEGLKAFETSVYTELRKNCIYCHNAGSTVAPPHSTENVRTSYYYQMSYMNWANLDQSKLIKKVAESHWIGKPNGEKVKTTEEGIRKAIGEWWEGGQKACPSIGALVSKPQLLPEDLTNWRRVRLELPTEADSLKKGGLSFEIMMNGKNYFIRKPYLEGIEIAAKLKHVHIILNGKGFETPFNLIEGVVEPEKEGKTAVLSAYTTYVPVDELGKDVLAFGVDFLKPTYKLSCKYQERFQNDVMPVLKLRNCYSCHGGNGAAGEVTAKSRLDMDLAAPDLCRALLTRGSGSYTVESPLIAYPFGGVNDHFAIIPHESEVLPAWTDWVKAEGVHSVSERHGFRNNMRRNDE